VSAICAIITTLLLVLAFLEKLEFMGDRFRPRVEHTETTTSQIQLEPIRDNIVREEFNKHLQEFRILQNEAASLQKEAAGLQYEIRRLREEVGELHHGFELCEVEGTRLIRI